jgi:hypothetical protein
MVAIVHAPRRPTILVALVAALGLAGAARAVRHHRHHRRDHDERVSLRAAHHRCVSDHRITDAERLRDVQTRIESGRGTVAGLRNDDNPPRTER